VTAQIATAIQLFWFVTLLLHANESFRLARSRYSLEIFAPHAGET
jgi:hypothetical protein